MCTVREFYYPSSDGVSRVYAREWSPEGAARAVLQLAHGICEHLGRYDDFARFMAGNGVLVVANDHLGHGRTAAFSPPGTAGRTSSTTWRACGGRRRRPTPACRISCSGTAWAPSSSAPI